ncbi:MAG: LamG domain-containing protein, partial [Epsilonproteobacteria bacterium]|nr:LamG domain-containing protein [Campylobacterota bacterium]
MKKILFLLVSTFYPLFGGTLVESFPSPANSLGGAITLNSNTQVNGTTNNTIVTQSWLNNGGACDGATCVKSNTLAPTYAFTVDVGTGVDGWATANTTYSSDRQFGGVTLNPGESVTFENDITVKVTGSFDINGNSSTGQKGVLNINGHVTLYVGTFNQNSYTQINISNGGSLKIIANYVNLDALSVITPSDFICLATNELNVNTGVQLKGLLYTNGFMMLNQDVILTGAATANQMTLNSNAIINYNLGALASAPPSTPFTCTNESFVNYVTSGTFLDGEEHLAKIELNGGTQISDAQVNGLIGVTSLGYNVQDNHLWGYNMANKKIVRIDANYNSTIYNVTGIIDELYSGADVNADGILHLSVHQSFYNSVSNTLKIERIDLNTATPTKLAPLVLNQTIDALDIAFNPIDNNIYFIASDGKFYRITISNGGTTGTVELVGDTSLGLIYNVVSYFDKDGNFYFNTDSTKIYQLKFDATGITTQTPFSTLNTPLTQGDGAMCANATVESPSPSTPTPIAEFRFDDCGGDEWKTDYSSIGNNATGNPSIISNDFKNNMCNSIENDSWDVNIPDHTAYDIDEGTISIMLYDNHNVWANARLIGKGWDANNQLLMEVKDVGGDTNKGTISVNLSGNTIDTGETFFTTLNNGTDDDSQWVHITLTFGASGMKLYINGVLKGSNAYTGGINGIPGDIAMPATSGYFDEFYMFDGQMDNTQVSDLYSNTVANKNIDGTPRDCGCNASGTPFTCPTDAFIFTATANNNPTDLYSLDLTTGGATLEADDFHSNSINAAGYNTIDNLIWGYDNGAGKVISMDKDNNITAYTVVGLPNRLYYNGDVDSNGILYLFGNNDSDSTDGLAYKVNLNNTPPTMIGTMQLPKVDDGDRSANFGDWAFHPTNGKLYAISETEYCLYEIDPTTGVMTKALTNFYTWNATTSSNEIDGKSTTFDYHSTVFDANGNLYFYGDDGFVFKIDLSDPANPQTPVYFSTISATTDKGDGARCRNATVTTPPPSTCSTGVSGAGKYAAGWWHNSPSDTPSANEYWLNYPNDILAGKDDTVISQAFDETHGAGTQATIGNTYLYLKGIDQTTLSGAISDNDYVEYKFTTANFTGTKYISRYVFTVANGHESDYYPYKFSILVSDKADFSSYINTVDNQTKNGYIAGNPDNPNTPGTHQTYEYNPTEFMLLEPNKTYYLRMYIYDDQSGGVDGIVVDDFNFGVDCCGGCNNNNQPFTCDETLYLSNQSHKGTGIADGKTWLHSITQDNVPYDYKAIGDGYDNGDANSGYNALGYNIKDNFMYALEGNTLLKIDSNATVENLGVVTGLDPQQLYAGEFDRDGFYYVSGNGGDSPFIYKIDINSTSIVDTIIMSRGSKPASVRFWDMAIDETGEYFYVMLIGDGDADSDYNNDKFAKINKHTGVITEIGDDKSAMSSYISLIYSDKEGKVFMGSNENGFYRANTTSGDVYPISSTSDLTFLNDGTSCPDANITESPSITINDVQQYEGDSGVTQFVFTVSLNNPAPANAGFWYTVTDGTAAQLPTDNDYIGDAKYVPLLAGVTDMNITINVVGDMKMEQHEEFYVDLYAPDNLMILDDRGVGTILNDDIVLFRVERDNSDLMVAPTTDYEQKQKSEFYTQLVNRDFDYSIVCYDKNTTDHNEFNVEDITLKVELRDHNSTLPSNLLYQTYIYFENSDLKSRKKVIDAGDLNINRATRDARFSISFLLDSNGSIIQGKFDNETDYNSTKTNYNASEGYGSSDNFAIRPASYRIELRDSIIYGSQLYKTNDADISPVSLAAEYPYNINIHATDINDSKVNQYTTYSPNELNVTLVFDDTGTTNCHDSNDSALVTEGKFNYLFNDGELQSAKFSHNNVGTYTLKLSDIHWTDIDKDFISDDSNLEGCIRNSASNMSDAMGKYGCNIATGVDNEHTDINIRFETYEFNVSNTHVSSRPKSTRNNHIYMSDLALRDDLGIVISSDIIAQGMAGTQLTNYTTGCFANDVNIKLDYN